jgi:hypothetical protein
MIESLRNQSNFNLLLMWMIDTYDPFGLTTIWHGILQPK